MTATTVVHLRREQCDIVIDRTTPFGNRYIVGRDGNRQACIDMHMVDWRAAINHPRVREYTLAQLRTMKGKRLGCHCAPMPCHGDNYVKLIAEFCS